MILNRKIPAVGKASYGRDFFCKETYMGLFVKQVLSVCKNTTNILIMQLWFHEECCFLNIR